jgi:DNA-binding transcriptional regulator GbsR (MarR family)/transcription elongation factor Elf1/uncharacterized membrane protein (DUF485 family)
MKKLQSLLIGLVIIALLLGLGLCLYIAGTRQLSSNETVMLGILLTIFSILISWIFTHLYSQATLHRNTEEVKALHAENIRTFAVKAAEKVFNLSNEFDRLNAYLRNIDYSDIDNSDIENLVLNERINATVHVIETLKSMNDTFLSDWKGVIGNEIQQQQNLEQQISEIQTQLESQQRIKDLLQERVISYDDLEDVQNHIEEMERRLGQMISEMPFRVRPIARKPVRQDITIECPNCASPNMCTLKMRKGARKLIYCTSCKEPFKIEVDDKGTPVAKVVPHVDFELSCILCGSKLHDKIPDYPGALKKVTCQKCDLDITVAKTKEGVNADVGYKKRLPPKFVNEVLEKLPPRPWPKGVHKEIAEKLGVSNSAVSSAIAKLLDEGQIPE